MTNNQRFDEHIKEQFNNYTPDVHPRIWENIAAQRDKKKPAGFWFSILNSRNILLLSALLLAGGSGAWWLIKNSTGNNSTKPVSENTAANKITPAVAVNTNQNTTAPENNAIATPPTVPANTATNTVTGAPESQPGNTSVTVAGPSANTTITNSSSITHVRTRSPFFEQDIQNGPIAYSKKQGRDNNRVKIKTTDGTLDENNNEVTNVNNDVLPVGGTLLSRLLYGTEKMAATRRSAEGPLVPNAFGFLPDCPALEKNAAGNKKYIEFYAGPDFGFRSLKDTGNSAYLQKRKESTKFTSAYSAGVRYTKVFSNGISVRGGVNYSQINEKFTFVQGNLVQVTYIIDANGDTTGSYITTGTRYKTTHNKYRSIDVPLMVGYELGNGRLHANINAGAVVNVYSWQRGEVLDTTYQPVNITTGKGSSPYQFKTNAGIGFMGAVSVYYKLNDKIHVMAEPYYRHNFSQMNKENLTIKQKYNTVGVKVGIRVDLR